jgi:hypothetical protein
MEFRCSKRTGTTMASKYRYFEIMRPSLDAFQEALAEALAEVETGGGEVATVALAILPMPLAKGPESKELVRVAQVLVREAEPGAIGT